MHLSLIHIYQLGESYAVNLGVNIKRIRVLLVLLSSLLSACIVAFAGPISFEMCIRDRINRVEDVLTLGDKVKVVCLGKDKMGRISFSMKDVKAVSYTHLDRISW